MSEDYRLFVSVDDRTFVRIWSDGTVEVSTREHPGDIWGPPVVVVEEKADA